MRHLTFTLVVAGVAAAVGAGRGDDDRPRADPPTTPLALTVSGRTTYTLDTGGLSPAAYRRRITDAAAAIGAPLPAPAVGLVAEVRNTSGSLVRVWVTGDPVVLDLHLKGPGAVTVTPNMLFTAEYRMPQAIDLPPGGAYPIPVRDLAGGFRGRERFSYWAEPGEYTLTLTLRTAVRPAPSGAEEVEDTDGFGLVALTSAPLRIRVEPASPGRAPGVPWWLTER